MNSISRTGMIRCWEPAAGPKQEDGSQSVAGSSVLLCSSRQKSRTHSHQPKKSAGSRTNRELLVKRLSMQEKDDGDRQRLITYWEGCARARTKSCAIRFFIEGRKQKDII